MPRLLHTRLAALQMLNRPANHDCSVPQTRLRTLVSTSTQDHVDSCLGSQISNFPVFYYTAVDSGNDQGTACEGVLLLKMRCWRRRWIRGESFPLLLSSKKNCTPSALDHSIGSWVWFSELPGGRWEPQTSTRTTHWFDQPYIHMIVEKANLENGGVCVLTNPSSHMSYSKKRGF
jgi:hypothetical protein